MPKFLEKKLMSEAKKKGMSAKESARYTFGAMNDLGAMRGNKETAKGREMDKKHAAKMKTEVHEYDHNRASRPVVSRYSK